MVGKSASNIVERVRGQTADLSWSLKVHANVELSDVRDAKAMGETLGADVVIWFDISSENRVVVNAVEVATERDFRRPVELEGDETKLSAFATFEAAALVVRSLLIALDRNEEEAALSQIPSESASAPRSSSTQGVASSQPSSAEASPPEARPVVPQSNARKSAEVSFASESLDQVSAKEAFEWQLAAGWHFVVDGVSPAGQHGPHFRLGLNPGHLQFALSGYLTFPAEIESHELTIELQRYGLLASMGYEFFPGTEFRLSTSLAGGILLIARSTRVHVSGLIPTRDATVKSLVIEWDTRVQWFPVWVEQIAGLELAADLAIIPASVDFGIREGEELVSRKESWRVQPSFCLSFVLRIE